MIYGRFGDPVELVRLAVWGDIRELEHRKGDAQDKRSITNKSYVVVRHTDDGSEALYHLAFLRADNGIAELSEAFAAIGG